LRSWFSKEPVAEGFSRKTVDCKTLCLLLWIIFTDELFNSYATCITNNETMATFESFNLAASFYWAKLIDHISHEEESDVVFVDQWGNTCLHQASFNKPPLNAIEALLSKPRLIRVCFQRARDGSTPFLVACGCMSSYDVLYGMLRKVKQEFPGELKLLADLKDYRGNSPFRELWIAFTKSTTFKLYTNRKEDLDICLNSFAFRDFLKKAKLVLYAAFTGELLPEDLHEFCFVTDRINTAHAFGWVSCTTSPEFYELYFAALSKYIQPQHEIEVSYSLHVAAATNWNSFMFSYFAEGLLKLYPEASCLSSHISCEYPLHIALKSGKKFSSGLTKLIESNPSALRTRDSTMFFPFMLAAINSRGENQCSDLNTVFDILRKDPAVCSAQPMFQT